MLVDMKNLTFPRYRIVEDVTPDDQLGLYSPELWAIVERDLSLALKENSEVYDECERKIYEI